MAEIGQQEVRLMSNSFVTLTGLSISMADVVKAIFDKEPDFFAEYIKQGGRVRDDLLIPSSNMDEFSMRMSNHKNDKGESEPLHFSVLEELEIPCSFEDPNAEVLLDESGTPVVGPIPAFDKNGMPLYDEDGLVYQTERILGEDGSYKDVPLTGNLYVRKMSRIIYCDGIDAKQHSFFQDTNTFVGNVIDRDGNTPLYESAIGENNEVRATTNIGIQLQDGAPVYTKYNDKEEIFKLAADLGSSSVDYEHLEALHKDNIFSPKEHFLDIESKWAGKETVKITDLSFAEATMIESVLGKENIKDYLVIYDENNPDKPYEIELDWEEINSNAFGESVIKKDKLIAEIELSLAHPDIVKGIKEIEANGKLLSNYLAGHDAEKQSLLLFPTIEAKDQYIELTADNDKLAYHLHGFDEIDKTVILSSSYSKAELAAAITSMGPYSIVEGTKAATHFKELLEQDGISGLKNTYIKKYDQTTNIYDTIDYLSDEVNKIAKSSHFDREATVMESERIPNSDKIISFAAKEFENNVDSTLTELESDKLDRMYEAINENKIHMNVTAASDHVQTASYMLKDHEMFAIDDRTYGDAISLSKSATAQEQTIYNESVIEEQKGDLDQTDEETAFDDYEPEPGEFQDDF